MINPAFSKYSCENENVQTRRSWAATFENSLLAKKETKRLMELQKPVNVGTYVQ